MEYNNNSQKSHNNYQNENNGEDHDINENDVIQSFNYFDINHNGKINVDEIKEILKSFGDKMTEEEIYRIFKLFNIKRGKNGYMDYFEFLENLKNN